MRAVSLLLLACTFAIAARAEEPSSASSTSSAPASAVALEEEAFAAIDAAQWCLAMRLFERAHALGPAAGLLHNAARAAELGGDLDGAVVVQEQIKTFAGSSKAQRSAAIKKSAELKKQIAREGPGTACAGLDVLKPAPAVAPSSPVAAPVVVEAAPVVVEDHRPVGFVVAGVGGAAVVAGGVLGTIGLLPWFAHADALERVLRAERDKADATSAQADQTAAREAWDGHGRLLTIVGGAAVGAGLIAVAGGLGYALTRPVPDEETP